MLSVLKLCHELQLAILAKETAIDLVLELLDSLFSLTLVELGLLLSTICKHKACPDHNLVEIV